jgi:hypothetical protein
MGHYLFYVVDMPGAEFKNKLVSEYRATSADTAMHVEEDGYWEGQLPHTKEGLGVELSGVVTVICYPTKYVRYLTCPEIAASVLLWEKALRSLFPSYQVIKFHERLGDEWETIAGEHWFRDRTKSDRFRQWIKEQENELWAIVH